MSRKKGPWAWGAQMNIPLLMRILRLQRKACEPIVFTRARFQAVDGLESHALLAARLAPLVNHADPRAKIKRMERRRLGTYQDVDVEHHQPIVASDRFVIRNQHLHEAYQARVPKIVATDVIVEDEKVVSVPGDVALHRWFEDRCIGRLMVFTDRDSRNGAFHRHP